MNTTTTTTTEDRTLYGCPSWCTFDHAGETLMEPGDHWRDLTKVAGEHGDAAGLSVSSGSALVVAVYIGPDGSAYYPATRETVEHLRDVARMLREASDELSGLLQAGDVE